jgi:hypothetical protein
MSMSKLTLTAPPEIISLAKEVAKCENTSISAMFVDFIVAKTKQSRKYYSKQNVGPLTKSLTGIVKLPKDFDEKEFINDVFTEKYNLDK